MGFYQPLFTVSVGHQYFADGLWKELDFIPEAGTLKIIDSANALLRKTGNGIAVFYDADKLNALRLCAKDTEGVLRFSFKVSAKDRMFANYTASPVQKEDAVLYFSNRGGAEGAAGAKIKLSKDDFVSGRDFEDAGTLDAGGIHFGRGKNKPDFVVDIFIAPAETPSTSSGQTGLDAREYVVNFNARQSYLKYHLLGSMNRNNLFIVDLDNQMEFEFCGDVMLPDNKPAKVFRSKGLLPIQEMPNARFQLRERGQGTGKVLVKRLPAASESRLGMELINGKNEIVAESFINC